MAEKAYMKWLRSTGLLSFVTTEDYLNYEISWFSLNLVIFDRTFTSYLVRYTSAPARHSVYDRYATVQATADSRSNPPLGLSLVSHLLFHHSRYAY